MRVTGDWLEQPASQRIARLLTDAGHQALFVGGCVRNALLNAPVNDIDISTDACPTRVMELAQAAGIKAVPTGIDHGTVTLVEQGIPFEVTTFRKDVETDGRRAVVAFADTVREDAVRRDFTMNALYCDASGTVVDPLGGLPDLVARHVRFIENPEQRIREDYLRILRFFRFTAFYGAPEQGFDADALAAIAEHVEGLETLSIERVTSELLKILTAPNPALAIASMAQTGVLMRVLVGADARALPILVDLEEQHGLAPNPVRRLAAIAAPEIVQNLRLSNADRTVHMTLREAVNSGMGAKALGYRLGAELGRDAVLLGAALLGMPVAPNAMDDVAEGALAVFPVSAQDLMPVYQGSALGERLKELESLWIASGFKLSKVELLA